MKKILSSLAMAATLTAGFVPTYIVDKYTQCHADGSYVHTFGVVKESPANRSAATTAQEKFVGTFGGCVFVEDENS